METGKCEWQERYREREKTVTNQINQNGVSGFNRTGSLYPLTMSGCVTLGMTPTLCGHVLDMRDLAEVSSSPF